ncbi:MAG: hypothetical protein HZA95_04140 [Candidatus Vogelbacteria bacterium]|nr:hypothetical protein [Candidatus Vogelbacteria bacterium]
MFLKIIRRILQMALFVALVYATNAYMAMLNYWVDVRQLNGFIGIIVSGGPVLFLAVILIAGCQIIESAPMSLGRR